MPKCCHVLIFFLQRSLVGMTVNRDVSVVPSPGGVLFYQKLLWLVGRASPRQEVTVQSRAALNRIL